MVDRDEHVWERGWEGHERAQRERLARLPLSAKLDWLEQAHDLIRHLARRRSVSAGAGRAEETSTAR